MTHAEQLKLIIARVQAIGASVKAGEPIKPNDAAWLRIAAEGETLAKVDTVATALGCSTQAVRQASWDGHFGQPKHGWLDVLDVLRGWAKRDRKRLLAKTNADEKLKVTRNEILEIRRDEALKKLVPLEEVQRTVMRGFMALKSRLLIVPRRLCSPLAVTTDPVDVETRIDAEIREALSEISSCEWYQEEGATPSKSKRKRRDKPTPEMVPLVKP